MPEPCSECRCFTGCCIACPPSRPLRTTSEDDAFVLNMTAADFSHCFQVHAGQLILIVAQPDAQVQVATCSTGH